MALMCEECKCSTYLNEETGMYSCESGCACCNDPDYESDWDIHLRMMNQVREYIKLYKTSLEQDLEQLNKEASLIWDDGNEIEEVSLNGQILATNHILRYLDEVANV